MFSASAFSARAADIDEALERAQSAHDLQLSLPGVEAAVEGEAAQPRERRRRQNESLGWLARTLGEVGVLLFWGIVIAAAALLLLAVARELPYLQDRLKRRTTTEDEAAKPQDASLPLTREQTISLLAEADRLAAAGQYAEAIRYLLFQTVEEIGQRVGAQVPGAFTSREIFHKATLPERARNAFSNIVAAVEISYFGGRGVDAEAYANCRQNYELFASAGAAT